MPAPGRGAVNGEDNLDASPSILPIDKVGSRANSQQNRVFLWRLTKAPALMESK